MKTRKGFTLIELMIVIAIIAIIAAIAIPNLMASRVRANEATAISAIKQVSTAQVTFQAGRQGRVAINTSGGASGFCDNYRNLAFGNPVGDAATVKLNLVSDAVANGFLEANGGSGSIATVATAGVAGTATAYQGYLFSSDPKATVNWQTNFATYGVPSTNGSTGNNVYWVGQAGTVYIMGVKTADNLATTWGAVKAKDAPTDTDFSTL